MPAWSAGSKSNDDLGHVIKNWPDIKFLGVILKKTVYTLNIGDYAPEIMKLTMPLMKRWADKIGADFFTITERKFPEFPEPYEKFQIKELSKRHGNDWNIFFDADALIHPDFWDITEVIGKEMTCSNGSDFVHLRFKVDNYFRRDGRWLIGKGNWCLIASDWCTDIWEPLDMTPDEAAGHIHPIAWEAPGGVNPRHLIDDFAVTRNIVKYGLKHILIPELSAQVGAPQGYLWHEYSMTLEQKLKQMKQKLMSWAVYAAFPEFLDLEKTKEVLGMVMGWDGKIDWGNYLSINPEVKKVAEVIKSWGIEI